MEKQITEVGIIGLGSRGLTILERLIHYGREDKNNIVIHIVNPLNHGAGIHNPNDADYILLNTVASQLSIFKNNDNKEYFKIDFYTWLCKEGYRINKNKFTVSKQEELKINKDDYVPRKLLGSYLNWCFNELIKNTPKNVVIKVYQDEVVDIKKQEKREILKLKSNAEIPVDKVFLTIGHAGFSENYNTKWKYDIKAQENIGIMGLGLTAFDIIASLTLGREGYFEKINGTLKYFKSGKEPKIFLFSRSGLPYLSRPKFNTSNTYQPFIFTKDNIEKIRKNKGEYRLNLFNDVLPLLFTEIKVRYFLTLIQNCEIEIFNSTKEEISKFNTLAMFTKWIDKQALKYGEFNIEKEIFTKLPSKFSDSDEYQKKITEILEDDLLQAKKGIQYSPRKAALESFRDLRDVIRNVVDFNGLEEESQLYFMNEFYSIMNRVVTGPHIERNDELVALIKSGVVKVPFGPNPTVSPSQNGFIIKSSTLENNYSVEVCEVLQGFIERANVTKNTSPLVKKLLSSGRIRPLYNNNSYIGGIELNRNLQPINFSGKTEESIWVLGPLSEGIKYYNHYVPSSEDSSPAFKDADRVVQDALKYINELVSIY